MSVATLPKIFKPVTRNILVILFGLIGHILSSSKAALINISTLTGRYPSQLKHAKVFTIYKTDGKSDPAYITGQCPYCKLHVEII